MIEHKIIKRKKVEDDFRPVEEILPYSEHRRMCVGEKLEPLYLKGKRTNEYDYFSCEKSHKIVLLDSWDFDFCPFCGEKILKMSEGR